MVARSSFARLLAIAPLLIASSSKVAALPSYSDSQQLVFGGLVEEDQSSGRQPDFVDILLSEAKKNGADVSAWEQGEVKSNNHKTPLESFKESMDLNDEVQKVALMAEAAAEDALAWIQPIATELEEEVKEVADDISTLNPPGSGWIWEVCGSRQEAVVLSEINVKPDPPIPGQNLTVYAKGTVNADIEEGTYADVVVKLGFIRLLSKRFDVCQLAEENDAELKCPKKQGEYEMTHTVELPREIPPARFNVHVSGKTQADVDLMCMDLNIDFGRR